MGSSPAKDPVDDVCGVVHMVEQWPLNNVYVVGSIPTLHKESSGGGKEQREGEGLRNHLGVSLKIIKLKWILGDKVVIA